MPQSQQGFSIIAAVFAIVVVSLILAVTVSVLSGRSLNTVQNLRTQQAHYAARSGLSVGLARALQADNCPASDSLTIAGYNVALSCTSSSVTEAGDSYTLYEITAQADDGNTGAATYVQRSVRTVAREVTSP